MRHRWVCQAPDDALAARKDMPSSAVDDGGPDTADDRAWHLAESPDAATLAEFELALERVFQSFYRWKSDCMAAVAPEALSGHDTAVLNVIRMRDRPKGLSEIARLLNRSDTSNIQYSLRKLEKAGLIAKDGAARKTMAYKVTPLGEKITDAYGKLREELLVVLAAELGATDDQRLPKVGRMLDMMSGLYEQAAQKAAVRRY